MNRHSATTLTAMALGITLLQSPHAAGQTVTVEPPATGASVAERNRKFNQALAEFMKECPQCGLGIQTGPNINPWGITIRRDKGSGDLWWGGGSGYEIDSCDVPAWLAGEKELLDKAIERLLTAVELPLFRTNDTSTCLRDQFKYRLNVLRQVLNAKK